MRTTTNPAIKSRYHSLWKAAAAILSALIVSPLLAGPEAAASTAGVPIAQAPAIERLPHPSVDVSVALAGKPLLDALRKGGYVLYLRHTETGSAITEQCDVSNLSAKGVSMARELGAQLKLLRVPVGRLVSSPVCRVRETAKLLDMGEVELSTDLAQPSKTSPATDLYVARMRLLAVPPGKGTNTVAVGHMHGGNPRYQNMDLEFGEIIVFRADGAGAAKPVARVRAEQWQALAAMDNAS